MPPRSTGKDTWSLRPGDLPSERIMRAEPLLADLENNAIFRAIQSHERRRWGGKFAILGSLRLVLVVAAVLLAGFIILPLYFIFRDIALTRGQLIDHIERDTGIRVPLWLEARQALVKHDDLLMAFWGTLLQTRRIAFEAALLGIGILVALSGFSGLIFVESQGDVPDAGFPGAFVMMILGWLVYRMTLLRRLPYGMLGRTRSTVSRLLKQIAHYEPGARLSLIFKRVLLVIFVFPMTFCLGGMGIAIAATAFDSMNLNVALIEMILGSAGGYFAGLMRVGDLSDHKLSHIRYIKQDLQKIEDWLIKETSPRDV
jgi:hypothetical protein